MSDLTLTSAPSVTRELSGNMSVVHVHRTTFDEIYINAVPDDRTAAGAPGEFAALYDRIDSLLAQRGAVAVFERIFGALGVHGEILERRAEMTGAGGLTEVPPLYIEGMPCDGDGLSGLHLTAVVPNDAAATTQVLCDGTPAGHLVEGPGARYIYLPALAGTTPDAALAEPEQATRMFHRAEGILREHGFVYRDTVRTWIYIGEILDWYDEFNVSRTAAYNSYGLLGAGDDFMPASTGIQGRPPGEVACAMDLLAVQPTGDGEPPVIGVLHNPRQNEAHAYGSAFARAMEVVSGGVRTVYVSGTASIDEFGKTIHLGDTPRQIERTVENIEALIGTRGQTLEDITQACVFMKRADEVGRFEESCAGTGFAEIGVPMAADVCRSDLLFEIDAVAAKVAE